MSPLDRVLDALDAVRPSGEGKWLARCPAHEDRSPSLSIAIGDDDRVLVHCFAGCTTEDIVAALGLEVRDLFSSQEQGQSAAWHGPRAKPRRHAPMPSEQQIATWRRDLLDNERVVRRLAELRGWTRDTIETLGLGYDGQRIVFPLTDVAGQVVGIARYLPGDRPNGEKKMLADAGSLRELWPAPESLDDTSAIWLTEGEPDGMSLASLGLQASAVPGAASWQSEWAARFAGRDVIICMDCDENGRALAAHAADDLALVAGGVRVVDLDSKRTNGYDVGDLVREAAEHGPEQLASLKEILERMAESAERFEPEWPAIGSRTLPAFPVDSLPRPVAAWVEAMAEHTQTPVDLPALAALVVLC